MKPLDIASLLDIPDISTHLARVERSVAQILTSNTPSLQGSLDRLVSVPSKRLRSVLVIAVAMIGDHEIDENVIHGCVAIELVHMGSLVHDDIIDSANTRWGRPTINSQEGINHAILVGDYLLANAGVAAATINSDAAHLISSTIAALCEGEGRELADEFKVDRTIDSLFASINDKTASLISAACQMGGLCATMNDMQVESFGNFGKAFGTAFQLIDDLLDLLSTSDLMGKPIGNDIKEGVYTLPILFALNGPERHDFRHLLSSKKADHAKITKVLIDGGHVKQTILEIKKYNHKAITALSKVTGSEALKTLPDTYLKWVIANLINETYRDDLRRYAAVS